MRKSVSAISLFVLLLNMSFAAFAGTNHTVTVGGSAGLVFTPSLLTITAGDTVTFKNVAGGHHNVVDDAGAFRCAVDCAANGGANSTAWTAVVTYSSAGNFGYYCEQHGAPGLGMFGSITVEAAPPPPPPAPTTIGGYLSGNWYNQTQSGSGFQLEVTSNANQMVAIWFVFAPGGGSQWIYAQGTYDPTSSTITMPAALVQNGKFPFPASNYVASDIQKAAWGTLTFTFSDCNTGVASWNSTVTGYGSGSIPITRLTQIAGTVCP